MQHRVSFGRAKAAASLLDDPNTRASECCGRAAPTAAPEIVMTTAVAGRPFRGLFPPAKEESVGHAAPRRPANSTQSTGLPLTAQLHVHVGPAKPDALKCHSRFCVWPGAGFVDWAICYCICLRPCRWIAYREARLFSREPPAKYMACGRVWDRDSAPIWRHDGLRALRGQHASTAPCGIVALTALGMGMRSGTVRRLAVAKTDDNRTCPYGCGTGFRFFTHTRQQSQLASARRINLAGVFRSICRVQLSKDSLALCSAPRSF